MQVHSSQQIVGIFIFEYKPCRINKKEKPFAIQAKMHTNATNPFLITSQLILEISILNHKHFPQKQYCIFRFEVEMKKANDSQSPGLFSPKGLRVMLKSMLDFLCLYKLLGRMIIQLSKNEPNGC